MGLRALLISVVTTLLSLFYSINQSLVGLRVSNYINRGYPFPFLLQVHSGPLSNLPAYDQYTFYPFNFTVDLVVWFVVAFVVLFMLRMAMKKQQPM